MKALRAIPWRTWDGEKHAKEDASPEEGHHAARHAKRLRRVIGSDRLAWQRCRWEELPLMNPAPGKCCSSPSSSSSSSSAQIAGPKNIQHKLINWVLRLGHISHSLGRTKYIVIYRMHSGGSDQITNILVYIPTSTHHSALQRKGSVLKSSNNNKAGSSKRGGSAYLRNAWQCSYSSRIIWLPVFVASAFGQHLK